MIELICIALLGYGFFNYRAVNIALRVTLFVLSVLGLLVLLKLGFVSVFLTSVLSIPIDLVKGVFGIFYHLLIS